MANSSCPLPECDSPDPHPIHPMSKGPEPSSTKHVRFQEEVIRESYEVLSPRYQWGSCYSSMDDDSDDIDSLFPRAPSADELKKQYGQAVRHILDLGSTSTLSTTRHFIEGAEAPSPALSLSSRSSFGLSEKGSCSDDEEMRTPNPQERKRVVRNRLRRRRSLMSRTSSLQHSTSKDSGLPTLRNPPPLTLPVLSALRSKKSAGSSDLSSPSEMGHGLGGRDGDDEGSPSSATASATVSILSPPMRADDRVGDHRQGTSTQSTNRHSDLGATLRRHVSFEDRRLHTDEDDNDNDDFFSSERRERRSELIRSRKRTGVTRLTADQLEELQAAFAPTEDDLTASDEHHDPYPYMRHRPPGLSPPGGRDRDRDRRVGKNGKNVSFGPSQQAGEDGEPDADFYHPDRRDLRARMIRGRKKTGVTPLSPEQRAELRDLMCCDADMSTPMAESTSTSAAAAAAAELRPPECDGGIPRKVSFTEGSPSVLGPDDTSAFDDPDRRRRRQELCRRRKKTGYVRLSESELAELRNEFYHYYSEEEQQRQRQLQGAASARGDMMSAAAAAAAAAGEPSTADTGGTDARRRASISTHPPVEIGNDDSFDAPSRQQVRFQRIRTRKNTGPPPLSPDQLAELQALSLGTSDTSAAAAASSASREPPPVVSFDPQTAGMVDERRDELYRSDPEFYNPVRRQLRQLRVRGRRKTPVINLGPSQLQELRALESSSSSRMANGEGEGEGEVSVGAAAAAAASEAVDACEGAADGGKEEENREEIEIEEGQHPVGQGLCVQPSDDTLPDTIVTPPIPEEDQPPHVPHVTRSAALPLSSRSSSRNPHMHHHQQQQQGVDHHQDTFEIIGPVEREEGRGVRFTTNAAGDGSLGHEWVKVDKQEGEGREESRGESAGGGRGTATLPAYDGPWPPPFTFNWRQLFWWSG